MTDSLPTTNHLGRGPAEPKEPDLSNLGDEKLKYAADAENEIHDLLSFRDYGHTVISPIAVLPPDVALGVVTVLAATVAAGHANPESTIADDQGIVRAQKFEEGDVFMVAAPFDGFSADRYLMDFYDVNERDLCSRMHVHTGMRFVRMMTGPATQIRVSALSPIEVASQSAAADLTLDQFSDSFPVSICSDQRITRYNVVVPACSWVDMQIPRGTAHQFNAIGPHAVIDTVHPEESIEIFRERASRINMMAQTIFLEDVQSPASACGDLPNSGTT